MAGKKFDITKFAATLPEAVPESGMTREIPVSEIFNNPRNFYPLPSMGELTKLKESIETNGLLEPPSVVQDIGGKYRLISGHSRMAAVRLLHSDDHASAEPTHKWDTVLCRVLPAMTDEQELCAVIEANRQRVKSNALLAQEVEKLKENYIRRKKAGEEFPVGLRDWVAKEMQINATKVGNLQVIKKGLKVPGIIARWEKGELPEAAALEIARMSLGEQHDLWSWMVSSQRTWTIRDVQEFIKSREATAQASEDEKYIELLTHMRDSLEQTLQDCADRQAGILALKNRFRWAGGGSSEGGFDGTSKGLELYGDDGKRILRPWATVWDMLAAMRLQEGPAPKSETTEAPPKKAEPKSGAEETLISLAWHESDVEPPEGAHIVFIDENGVADEDVYVSGRLESGWADWDEVVLWTLYPDDPAQPEAASEKQLTTLCAVDLAAPEWQAGNPPTAGEYYACFDIGKNACRLATWSGWDWRFVGGATIEAPCLGWWPLPSRASAKEGA